MQGLGVAVTSQAVLSALLPIGFSKSGGSSSSPMANLSIPSLSMAKSSASAASAASTPSISVNVASSASTPHVMGVTPSGSSAVKVATGSVLFSSNSILESCAATGCMARTATRTAARATPSSAHLLNTCLPMEVTSATLLKTNSLSTKPHPAGPRQSNCALRYSTTEHFVNGF